MTRRKFLRGAAATLLTTAALAGCSVGPSGSGGGEAITFLTFETPNLTPAYWDAAIKRVTDKHPEIKVTKLVAPSADGRTAYAKQLLQSGQFPDVLVGVSPAGFAEAGELYAWQPDDLKDFQFPTANPIQGKYFQLPANTQTIPPIYYNKKLFQAAGVTGEPKTWDELLAAAEKLKAAGTTPFVIGGGKDGFASSMILAGIVSTDLYGDRKDWLSKRREDKVKFTDPEFVVALEKFGNLAERGYIDKNNVSRDYAATEQAFLDGQGAMYPMGNWFAASADSKQHDFEIGVFNFPTQDGKLVVPAYTGGGMIVSANAKNQSAARKFALAFQLDKEQLDQSVKADGLFPAIKGYQPPADTGPVFKAGYELYQKAVQENAVVNAFRWETADDGLLPGMADKIDAAAQDLVTGRKNAAEVATYLDAEWTKAS
ncbi:extracellular solute-binding protein [Saccharothrix sp.]|uniref:ABC transporter substrate-binding protein n=1 Tax=Saccharothrix sp. TaxID=1873460 RepID=UPI002810BDFB|nr:extracellular solute-binding protein [Saccharothrix sp.]